MAGMFSFLAQFWFRWYEVDYGGWEASDYDAFGSIIPQILDGLLWGGLAIAIIGIILMIYSRKLETEENKSGKDR